MLIREVSFERAPGHRSRWRHVTAALLRAASRGLDRMAAALAQPVATIEGEPLIEFHAEAGALEGALYVNGQLLGYLPGVNRL
jgi:hypothetical protein